MCEQAFEVVSIKRTDDGHWCVAGRAYLDVNLGDALETSSTGGAKVKVVGIVTYGRGTDLLSGMMTGELILEGEIHEPLNALYAPQ
ncbi:hypothetical protein SAMN06272721_103198 [Arthrobacter sp. P2b]|nr:hypothetical protein SAMN06272721_103198 [Arthrobacter sp. P2b]